MHRLIPWLLIAIAALASQARAQSPNEPYAVSVWAVVLFAQDGRPSEITLVDEARYPAKFADNVKARLERARVPPPQHEGHAATLRSGVELRFTVTPSGAGGTVRMDGVSIGPMPTRQYLASYPEDVGRSGGWQGDVTGICKVSTEGRCSAIDIAALPGMPESVRRFAKASLEKWEFEPQQVNGKPIEGEYRLRLRLNTLDSAPDHFRQDKFYRILGGR